VSRLALGVVALLLTGCASLTPAQEQSVAEIEAFAERTARSYSLPPIPVLISHNPRSPAGSYRRGFFSVNALTLTSSFRDAIVAHELAHYVLGHDAPLRGPTLEDYERERQERELEANAKAVEILTRAAGLDEERALKTVYLYLLGVHWALERYPRMDLAGHKPPCEEIADLLSRFPLQRGWTAALECAPPQWRTSGG
jgi:IrrE N-terminal-like domain